MEPYKSTRSVAVRKPWYCSCDEANQVLFTGERQAFPREGGRLDAAFFVLPRVFTAVYSLDGADYFVAGAAISTILAPLGGSVLGASLVVFWPVVSFSSSWNRLATCTFMVTLAFWPS